MTQIVVRFDLPAGFPVEKIKDIIADVFTTEEGRNAHRIARGEVVPRPTDEEIDTASIKWANENCDSTLDDLTYETELFSSAADWMRSLIFGEEQP